MAKNLTQTSRAKRLKNEVVRVTAMKDKSGNTIECYPHAHDNPPYQFAEPLVNAI